MLTQCELRCTGNEPWPKMPQLQLWGWSWGQLHGHHVRAVPQRMRMGQDMSTGCRVWAGKGRGIACSQTCFPFLQQPWCLELAQCSRSSMVLDTHIWTLHYCCGRLQIHFPINSSRTWLHSMLKCSIWKHVFQNPVKTRWLKYNTQIFRLLHKFRHRQWIKQGIQRQLEIPRGTSRYIKAQLLAIYSFQLLCCLVLAPWHMLELFAF